MRLVRLVLLVSILASGVIALANSIAPVKLADLFVQADSVVAVEVLSGTSNSYDVPVYKAKITEAFKGAKTDAPIFFGPFLGTEVGGRYLLFLKHAPGLSPIADGEPNYGAIPQFNHEMYAGYSALKLDYACVFEGPDVADRCGEAVFLNPEQIVLPDSLHVFPKHDLGAETNYKGWVIRDAFFAYLRQLKNVIAQPQ